LALVWFIYMLSLRGAQGCNITKTFGDCTMAMCSVCL
jgi:hypothetical protein